MKRDWPTAVLGALTGVGLLWVGWQAWHTTDVVTRLLGVTLWGLGVLLLGAAARAANGRPAGAERPPHQRLRGGASVPPATPEDATPADAYTLLPGTEGPVYYLTRRGLERLAAGLDINVGGRVLHASSRGQAEAQEVLRLRAHREQED